MATLLAMKPRSRHGSACAFLGTGHWLPSWHSHVPERQMGPKIPGFNPPRLSGCRRKWTPPLEDCPLSTSQQNLGEGGCILSPPSSGDPRKPKCSQAPLWGQGASAHSPAPAAGWDVQAHLEPQTGAGHLMRSAHGHGEGSQRSCSDVTCSTCLTPCFSCLRCPGPLFL